MRNTFKVRTPERAGRFRRAAAAVAWGLFAAAAGFGLSLGLRAAPPPHPAATHVVRIEGMQFSPATVQVQPGDRVAFTNADLVPHTVTSTGARAFDSGVLEPGKTWLLTCDGPGTLPYHCILHPTMTGSVVVRPDAGTARE